QAPVTEIQLAVLESAPGSGSQREFFSRQEEECESWSSLVGRLSEKLGKDRVFVAEWLERRIPERAWRAQVPRALWSPPELSRGSQEQRQDGVALSLPDRPSRL